MIEDQLRERDVLELVRHELQCERYSVCYQISPHLLNADVITNAVGEMVMRLSAHIYGRWEPEDVHEYPSDWWQAFKERWFPEWALKRWPVETTIVTAKRGIIYPQFANCGHGVSADRLIVMERKPMRPIGS